MTFFLIILFSMLGGDVVWWAVADSKVRRLQIAPRARLAWRLAIGAWALAMAGLFVAVVIVRILGHDLVLPEIVSMASFIWHLIVLPITLLCFLVAWLVRNGAALGQWAWGKLAPRRAVTDDEQPPAALAPTRRQFLTAGAASALPLLGIGSAVGWSVYDQHRFRVRRITIPYAHLPRELDGVTIAHLSDTHFGGFTGGDDLPRILQGTLALRPDVVTHTGDLINHSLDDLPMGLDLLRQVNERVPVVMCEGNHDLFEGRVAFERRVREAGVPLLVNERHTVRVRGYPLQFLGLRWGAAVPTLDRRQTGLAANAAETFALRDPDPFTVLLAHHPHAFDYAAQANVGLTLAGHTHGGQVMLTDRLGPGPLMYKYWSGLYRAPNDAACVVSNGIGNWFPLRINAPAEIVHITLKRA